MSSPAKGCFVRRREIEAVEWDSRRKDWIRPHIDRNVLKELTQRSTANGLIRILYFVGLLTASAVATVFLAQIHLLLAVVGLYVYYFFYGFWVAVAHELQHQTVLARRENWLSEAIFYFVQTLIWNSPTYARVSHRLHHRYTMVRGHDPETEWPDVITYKWLRKHLAALILRILVVGAVWDLGKDMWTQLKRAAGVKNWMIASHCTEDQARTIRIESAQILLSHLAVIALAIATGTWWLLAFVTIAWQIGAPIERIWHDTKHIARPYNVKDHRLNTRSVKVGRFVKTFFWGLDDHVDHHLYPAVPSRNLGKLHEILKPRLPEPDRVFGCWAEMFEISRRKEKNPEYEYLAAEGVGVAEDAAPGPGGREGAG
jgi:fatty acid desaturase